MPTSASALHRGGRLAARRLSIRTRGYLRNAAVADLGCIALGVFIAAQLRFGPTCVALSIALPVLWSVTPGPTGEYGTSFIADGSDEFREVLNAGVSPSAVIALFSRAISAERSRGHLLIALHHGGPSVCMQKA